jgi:hypothetical protein
MRAFSRVLRSAVATATVLTGLTTLPPPAHAAPLRVADVTQSLAQALATSLSDAAWAGTLRTRLDAGTHDALSLAAAGNSPGAARFRTAAANANAAVLAAKGLPATTGSILEVRLAGRGASTIALVAAERPDDDGAPVTAFDTAGRTRSLSASATPSVPVAIVGIDERRALAAGIDVVRAELRRRGVGSAVVGTAGFWTTRLMSVRLSDDEEPWFKGDAEIYSIVSGVGADGKPQVDMVQMPYLEDDGTTYTPGQIVVDWSHFKYNAVDVVMMEEDDGTNYRALAQALATALLTILDGVQYAPMVNAILEAMPDGWWTDDPDYVDSWYLLTRQTNEWRRGARQNAGATFAPYFVGPVFGSTDGG